MQITKLQTLRRLVQGSNRTKARNGQKSVWGQDQKSRYMKKAQFMGSLDVFENIDNLYPKYAPHTIKIIFREKIFYMCKQTQKSPDQKPIARNLHTWWYTPQTIPLELKKIFYCTTHAWLSRKVSFLIKWVTNEVKINNIFDSSAKNFPTTK